MRRLLSGPPVTLVSFFRPGRLADLHPIISEGPAPGAPIGTGVEKAKSCQNSANITACQNAGLALTRVRHNRCTAQQSRLGSMYSYLLVATPWEVGGAHQLRHRTCDGVVLCYHMPAHNSPNEPPPPSGEMKSLAPTVWHTSNPLPPVIRPLRCFSRQTSTLFLTSDFIFLSKSDIEIGMGKVCSCFPPMTSRAQRQGHKESRARGRALGRSANLVVPSAQWSVLSAWLTNKLQQQHRPLPVEPRFETPSCPSTATQRSALLQAP